MSKKDMGAFNYIYPIPAILFGTLVNGKPNYTTLGNCGIISMEPCTIYVSSHKSHYANVGAIDTGHFSVNIPSVEQVIETDYCGMVSGRTSDKSKVFKTFYGRTDTPMIEECPVNLECRVINKIDIYDMEVFIGEVINSYINEDCLENGIPVTQKINPLFYDISNVYRSIGGWSAEAFSVGKDFNVRKFYKSESK